MPIPSSDISTATSVENKKSKYTGLFPAVVENVWEPIDPRKLARVQVRVFSLHSEEMAKEILPWAYFSMPIGTRFNEGGLPPVRVGDHVLVMFMYSDPDYPVIMSGLHFCPEEKTNLPHEIWDGDTDKKLGDGVEYKRVSDEPKPGKHEYFRNLVFTWHGVTAEIREDSSWGMTQREKGTSFFVDSDANFTIHGEKNCWISAKENSHVIIGISAKTEIGKHSYLLIGQDSKVQIGNNSDIEIGKESSLKIGGNSVVQVAQNYSKKVEGNEAVRVSGYKDDKIANNYVITVSGSFRNQVSGNYQDNISGSLSVQVGGNISENAGGSIFLNAGSSVKIISGGIAIIKASVIFLN